MQAPEIPPNDEERLRELYRYEVLDSAAERAFDDLTGLAAHILDVPIALVSLVDRDRQWFKSRHGLDAVQTSREISFCGHAVAEGAVLCVPDALSDERFSDNPLVVGDPCIRFYLGVPLVTDSGHALGTMCVIDRRPREVTDHQVTLLTSLARQAMSQIELRLQLAQRDDLLLRRRKIEAEKDAFISLVNHELRTPLTSITGSLKLLSGGVAGELAAPARSLVDVAERNAGRLLALISGLLDLDKIQQGSVRLHLEDLDARALAVRCVENNAGFAHDEDVELQVDPSPGGGELYPVRGDRVRLLQVLDNLVSNAVKYSPTKGVVTLRVERDAHRVRISVSDTGPGVPESFRERLFERFSQSDLPPRSTKPSSGLGLSIAHALVELHDGALYFEPVLPSGSRFVVELAASTPPLVR